MALPSVQKAKMETLKAMELTSPKPAPTLSVVENSTSSSEPRTTIDPMQFAVDSVVPEVSSDPEAPLKTELERLRAEEEKNEQRWRSLKGMNQRLETDNEDFKRQIVDLKTTLQEIRTSVDANKPLPPPDMSEQLTPEEETVYKDSRSFVEKVSKQMAKKTFSTELETIRKELKDLKESQVGIAKNLSSTSEDTFVSVVRSVIPSFDTISKDPKWESHLRSTKVPFSKDTLLDALTRAVNSKDLDAVKEIYSSFKPTGVSLEKLVTPPINGGGSGTTRSSESKPVLKLSARKQASEDFRKGRLKSQQFAEISAIFKEAEKEGRLDINA